MRHVNADAAVVTVTLEVGAARQPRPEVPLAVTGADFDVLVVWALALIVLGLTALLLARIRLETSHG